MFKNQRRAARPLSLRARLMAGARAGAGMPAAGALCLALLVPALPHEGLAQALSFDSVRVEGNERVEDATVVSYLGLPRGGAVSAAQVNAGYQALVESGLFESVEIVPSGSTLVVRVVEAPIVSRIAIEGNRRIDDEALLPLIGSTPRRAYSAAQAERDADAIAAAYASASRFSAVVTPRIIRREGGLVDLVFEVSEAGAVEVERISFVGNRSFSDSRLRRELATKQAGLLRQIVGADTFIAERIAFDQQVLSDFYTSRGFADFRILDVNSEVARQRDAAFVTFVIQEGPQYRFGPVAVASQLPEVNEAEFLAAARVRPGSLYTPVAIERSILRMERLALEKRLDFIRIQPRLARDPASGVIGVTFDIDRGPRVFVERIDIEGNNTTLDRVIRRQFDTVEGDPFNPRAIRAAAERIRALGYFSDVAVETAEGSTPQDVVIDVNVEETTTGALTFGASYSADTGVGVTVGLRENNFLGRGQRLAFSISTSEDNRAAAVSFFEPSLLGRDLGGGIDVFYRTTSSFNANYDTTSAGISPQIVFPVGENSRLSLRYTLGFDELSIEDGIRDNFSPIIVRDADRGEQVASSVGYTFRYDTRDSGLNPDAGVYFRFGQDLAGLGGDAKYLRTTSLAGAQARVLRGDLTLRAELELGGITGYSDYDPLLTDRFFTSPSTLRGFESRGIGPRDLDAINEDPLGGEYFSVARFEAGFPIGLPEEYGITGGAFADVGSVWGLSDTDGAGDDPVDDSFNLRAAVGLSVFARTPIGPLRFNFSKAVAKEDYDREQNFDLTIETSF